jgi:hypothetical protein
MEFRDGPNLAEEDGVVGDLDGFCDLAVEVGERPAITGLSL